MPPPSPPIRSAFDEAGYVVHEDLLPRGLVEAAAEEVQHLFSDFPPDQGAELVVYGPSEKRDELLARIDHPHLVSPAIEALLHHPAFAEAASGLMDGNAIQAWYVHASSKPPANGARTHIGWHQDGQYSDFMDGRFVTAWIPLTAIDVDDSPLCYIRGSHRLGIIGGSGFSGNASPDELRQRLMTRCGLEWNEVEICARPGTVSFHDSLIVHGSYGNASPRRRIALTVHMRTERNHILAEPGYRISLDRLRDPRRSPLIRGGSEDFTDLHRSAAC